MQTNTIQNIFSIAQEAGAAILDIYRSSDNDVDYKKDNSPLTLADKRSHEIITKRLNENYPHIPVLSEAAGGSVLTEEGFPLRYNKKSLRNPALVTTGDKDLHRKELV